MKINYKRIWNVIFSEMETFCVENHKYFVFQHIQLKNRFWCKNSKALASNLLNLDILIVLL
ncbi:hypothetical protein C6356_28255 [Bacillus wiedmannii]|uniref:Uncharacterized protein n=1 Tax=Bacillus wiedmannii TaxID=1890302 RepID=A0ABX5DM01_9BACI|nr:hypothetical protein C6356_28255 [Bacillus wiedmannii]PRT35372.1 hypothetical protein C6357_29035 [Bacillus wiedmannii]